MQTSITPAFDSQFLERQHFRCINVCGPVGSGKTAYLNALADYFGVGSASPEQLAEYRAMGLHERGCHPVIRLDFSDFRADSYMDAIASVRQKMSALYVSRLHDCEGRLRHYEGFERYLDIMEGTCVEKALAASLGNMVHALRRPRQGFDVVRPMIFIDEVSRPLLLAAHYGYIDEMRSFMDSFLDIDHYELTGGIVTTSYAPANTDVSYSLKYLEDLPVNDVEPLAEHCRRCGIVLDERPQSGAQWWEWRRFDMSIGLVSCYARLVKEVGDCPEADSHHDTAISLDEETLLFIKNKRTWVAAERKAAIEAQRKELERERREYAEPLSEEYRSLIPSRFAGARELRMDAASHEALGTLNRVLADLFERYGPTITSREVYDAMQGLDEHVRTRADISTALENLEAYAPSLNPYYYSVDAHDSHWGRFDFQRKEYEREYGDLALVKAYLSLRDETSVGTVFEDVVRFLMDEGKHLFHAKVSRYRRHDQICLWVAREDFFRLEGYLESYGEELQAPLPFVAYRGKIGISREFATWESHNGVQACLISIYLSQLKSAEEVDVIDMCAQYVRAWNGDMPKDHLLTTEFKRADAQQFLVLLETLDVILGNAELGDGCLLLNGDSDLWYALGTSRNWHDVGKKLAKRYEKAWT